MISAQKIIFTHKKKVIFMFYASVFITNLSISAQCPFGMTKDQIKDQHPEVALIEGHTETEEQQIFFKYSKPTIPQK